MLRDELPTQRADAEPRVDAAPQPVAPQHGPATSALPDVLGRSVGRYRLLFSVARGGMGEVFAAALPSVGFSSVVAVKLLTSRDRTEEEVAAFVREARVTATISHKNVLSSRELGVDGGEPYLVMPFVRGVPLSRFVRALTQRGRTMEPWLAAWIAAQVCDGLAAAHELRGPDGAPYGLVHRDVSPQNVLLGYDGHVWLVDFGVAKLYESARTTETGVVKGKLGYMAPEQCRGEPLDRRADVFALGIVLHEMLTGRELFAGLPPAVAALRITSAEVEPAKDTRLGVPPALSEIAARALSPHPDDRFATAGAFGDALREALRGGDHPLGDAALAAALDELFDQDRRALEERLTDALGVLARRDEPAVRTTDGATTVDPKEEVEPRSRAKVLTRVALGAAALGVFAAVGLSLFGRGDAVVPAPAESAPLVAPVTPTSPTAPGTGASNADPATSARQPSPADATSSVARGDRPAPTANRSADGAATASAGAPSNPVSTATPTPSAQFKGEPFRTW